MVLLVFGDHKPWLGYGNSAYQELGGNHASQYVNIMRRRVVTLVDGKLFGDVRNGKYGDIV